MEFLSVIIEHIDVFLSWYLLIPALFISGTFVGLSFIDVLSDILQDMFKPAVILFIFFALLSVCKVGFQLQQFIDWKRNTEKEKQDKKVIEQNMLQQILSLTDNEAEILKYIFLRSDKVAWLPRNITAVILLLHKGYIEIISNNRPAPDIDSLFNLHKSSSDILCSLSPEIKELFAVHKEEILHTWENIPINKKLNYYQE